ncbi:hypothetical protein ACMFMG_010279 [Clarireedia jacksonii]
MYAFFSRGKKQAMVCCFLSCPVLDCSFIILMNAVIFFFWRRRRRVGEGKGIWKGRVEWSGVGKDWICIYRMMVMVMDTKGGWDEEEEEEEEEEERAIPMLYHIIYHNISYRDI